MLNCLGCFYCIVETNGAETQRGEEAVAPTTGRGAADSPAASLQIGPTAYPVFLRSPKSRALASAYSPFGSGSGGLQESNDRRSGEMAPRSAETSFQTSFSSPSSASFAPFSFFASLRGTRRPRKISRRRLRGWAFQFRAATLAPRLPQCFHSQPSASSTLLRMRASFPLKRRNVVLVSKSSFSLSVFNLFAAGLSRVSREYLHPGPWMKRTETKNHC